MPTKRKLADLYVRGKSVTVDDGNGEGVTVWLQKLSPVDQEKAVRKANAFRSRLVAEAHDETSELFLSACGEAEKLTRDDLLEFLSESDVGNHLQAIEAEVESDERWAKDGYLQGLYDSWNDGMKDRYAEDPDDPEAKIVFDAMSEYADNVSARVLRETKRIRDELDETRTDDQLRKKMVEQSLMSRVDIQWMAEYRRCQIWLSVRESEKNRAYYFHERDEVDALAQETQVALIKAYGELEVDVVEGKGSEETPLSSSSSELQVAGADSSGPQVQAG